MSEQMPKDLIHHLWEKVSEPKKRVIFEKINKMLHENLSNNSITPNTQFNFVINIAFDKEKPIEYMYLKGNVILMIAKDPIGNNVNGIMVSLEYIDISNDVDDFLDRQNSLTQEKNKSSTIGYETNIGTDSEAQKETINYVENTGVENFILSNTKNLRNEMERFIEKMKIDNKELSYNDIKDIYFLQKIIELQNQINNLNK